MLAAASSGEDLLAATVNAAPFRSNAVGHKESVTFAEAAKLRLAVAPIVLALGRNRFFFDGIFLANGTSNFDDLGRLGQSHRFSPLAAVFLKIVFFSDLHRIGLTGGNDLIKCLLVLVTVVGNAPFKAYDLRRVLAPAEPHKAAQLVTDVSQASGASECPELDTLRRVESKNRFSQTAQGVINDVGLRNEVRKFGMGLTSHNDGAFLVLGKDVAHRLLVVQRLDAMPEVMFRVVHAAMRYCNMNKMRSQSVPKSSPAHGFGTSPLIGSFDVPDKW